MLALSGYILCTVNCGAINETDEHPEFVNPVRERINSIPFEYKYKYRDQAVSFIDSAFKALLHPGIGDIYVKDSLLQFYYSVIYKDPLKALPYANHMLDMAEDRLGEEKYTHRYLSALQQKADRLYNLKRFHEFYYAISLAEVVSGKYMKDKCAAAQYSGAKGYVLFTQEKYLESASLFVKHYHQLSTSCKEDYELLMKKQACLNNVGECYLRLGILDSAAWYENEALKIISIAENKYPEQNSYNIYAKAVIMADQAEGLARKGNYHQAEIVYRKSIAGIIAEDVGYIQATNARLADAYLNDNKPGDAKKVLNALKLSLDTLPAEKLKLTWNKLQANYFKQINQPDSAFAYSDQYDVLADAVAKKDQDINSNDIANAFENLELTHTHENLQKESKIKNLSITGAAILFISAVIFALVAWINLKRSRILHQQVQQKNSAMQKTLSSLEQSHAENTRIIRIVAHDLKSPISSVSSMIHSLLKKDYPQELKEIFQVIKTACGNSLTLINDVLQQKKNSAAIKKDLVNMKRLLEYCVDLLQPKADEKNQSLTLEADEVILKLNRQKMWRVVSNIVTNAIKFSPQHGHIDVKLQRADNNVLLSVTDNGIGMSAELQDKIFSMSPEFSRTGTFGEESYGMGLSISRKIVEEHQGRIWFDSVQGQGSVFYVELPFSN